MVNEICSICLKKTHKNSFLKCDCCNQKFHLNAVPEMIKRFANPPCSGIA